MRLSQLRLCGVEPDAISVGEILVVTEAALHPADVNGIGAESGRGCAQWDVLSPPGLTQVLDPSDGMRLVEMAKNLPSDCPLQDTEQFGVLPTLRSLSNLRQAGTACEQIVLGPPDRSGIAGRGGRALIGSRSECRRSAKDERPTGSGVSLPIFASCWPPLQLPVPPPLAHDHMELKRSASPGRKADKFRDSHRMQNTFAWNRI